MMEKIVFFGAGYIGERSLTIAQERQMEIDCFVDNNQSKWGTECRGIKIHSPDYLKCTDGVKVVITVYGNPKNDILLQLESMGFVYGENIQTYNEALADAVSFPLSIMDYDDFCTESFPMKDIDTTILIADKKNMYRIVPKEKTEDFPAIYKRINECEELLEKIIPTSIVEHEFLGTLSHVVLSHEHITPISYAPEWSPLVFKDYCYFMIDFIESLNKCGLGLDAPPHLYDATFYNGRFIYLDYCAVSLNKTNVSTIHRVIDICINLLILTLRCPDKASMFLKSPSILTKRKDVFGHLDETEQKGYLGLLRNCFDLVKKGLVLECCNLLRDFVELICRPYDSLSAGRGYDVYQDKLYETWHSREEWGLKQRNVMALIEDAKPKSILDLAGNAGWYCTASADKLDYAIVADISAGFIDLAYKKARQNNISNVVPVCFNLLSPLPPLYHNNFIYTKAIPPQIKGAVERFNCDLVLALAIQHHLVLDSRLTFSEVIEHVALYTKRHIIIEFMDANDSIVVDYFTREDGKCPDKWSWYTKGKFEEALVKSFEIIKTAPSTATRTLYLCEKRRSQVGCF